MLGAPTGTLIGNFLSYISTTNTTYVALHSGTPSMFTPGSNEIGTRQLVTWSINAQTASNATALTFTGLSTANISYVTINDALTGGNVLFMIPLNEPYNLVAAGSTGIYSIAANSLFLSFETNPSVYTLDGGTPYTVWSAPSVPVGDGGTP
jgi:hypothetical protein